MDVSFTAKLLVQIFCEQVSSEITDLTPFECFCKFVNLSFLPDV